MERGRLDPALALATLVAAYLLLATVGSWLQLRLGLAGLGIAEVVTVLLPTLVAIAMARVAPSTGLGLELPRARAWVGGLLVAVGGFHLVAGGLEPLQERIAPLPPAVREQLQRLLVPEGGQRPLAVDLLLLAIAPALCEEALFRGALLRSLAPSGKAVALVASALAFGLFHFSLYKLLPTLAIGVFLGALALRAGSLWPSVVAHAANNTFVVLLVRAGHEDEPASLSSPWLLLPAALAVALGLALAGPPPARGK